MVQSAIVKKQIKEGVVEVSLLRQVECGLSCSGNCAGKSAGRQKDQAHGHDVIVADSLGGNAEFLIEGFPLCLEKRCDKGNEEAYDGRHSVEIIQDNSSAQKKD